MNSSRPREVCAMLAPIMQFYFYLLERRVIGTKKLSRGTCLAALRKGTWTCQMLAPGNLQRTVLEQ
jgi:hypothetical protein